MPIDSFKLMMGFFHSKTTLAHLLETVFQRRIAIASSCELSGNDVIGSLFYIIPPDCYPRYFPCFVNKNLHFCICFVTFAVYCASCFGARC